MLKKLREREPTFELRTSRGKTERFTAKELAERVEADAKRSDYDWTARPADLLDVAARDGFDADSAMRIMVCMLDCYANLLRHDVRHSDYLVASEVMRRLAKFNTREASAARQRYFTAYAKRAANDELRHRYLFGEYTGATAQAHIDEWCEGQGNKLTILQTGPHPELYSPDSPLLRQRLQDDFAAELRRMDDSRAYEAENAKQEASWRELAREVASAGAGL